MLRRPASVPPNCSHPALGGGHLSFTPESGSSESLASGINRVDFSAVPCHRVVPLGLCPPRRTLGLSLSRAPAIPAKRRTGDSESRRINAARRFTRVPFRKSLSIILVFPHTQGTPALRNGPSGEAARLHSSTGWYVCEAKYKDGTRYIYIYIYILFSSS